jgi:hypothetical protein
MGVSVNAVQPGAIATRGSNSERSERLLPADTAIACPCQTGWTTGARQGITSFLRVNIGRSAGGLQTRGPVGGDGANPLTFRPSPRRGRCKHIAPPPVGTRGDFQGGSRRPREAGCQALRKARTKSPAETSRAMPIQRIPQTSVGMPVSWASM